MPRRGSSTKTRTRRKVEPMVKRRSRHLDGVKSIDPQDYDVLREFVTEHGKIMPSRLIGATAKQQRQIKRAVRNARNMGLLP